jgi:hypothetical protein
MSEFEDILNRDQVKESQKNSKEKWTKFREEREREDLLWLLSDERGRRVIWKILKLCGAFNVSFSGDQLIEAFNSGKRIVGADIQKDIVEISGFKMLDVMVAEDNNFAEKEKEFDKKG